MSSTSGNADERGPARNTRAIVAKRAGVSVTTVSLVLNGRAEQFKIAAATRERVLAAARELHYLPNAAARALAGRKNRSIGLIISSTPDKLRMPVFSDVALAAVKRAQELGYFVLLIPVSAVNATDPLAAVRDASIAGLICEARGHGLALGAELKKAGMPLVWIRQGKQPGPALDAPTIEIDELPGVVQLADHFQQCDVGSIHLLVPDAHDELRSSRFGPLLDRFEPAIEIVGCGGWTSTDGRAAMAASIDSGARPEAIFAGNDLVAAGALHACRDAGWRVPGDVRLAGFGNFALGPDLDPPLTTVAWPLQMLAERAVDSLVDQLRRDPTQIEHDPDDAPVETLATELIVRTSA